MKVEYQLDTAATNIAHHDNAHLALKVEIIVLHVLLINVLDLSFLFKDIIPIILAACAYSCSPTIARQFDVQTIVDVVQFIVHVV